MKLYISLQKKYDKTEFVFVRVPARKRQKAIKFNLVKEELGENKNG